jgi:hypothetical protein
MISTQWRGRLEEHTARPVDVAFQTGGGRWTLAPRAGEVPSPPVRGRLSVAFPLPLTTSVACPEMIKTLRTCCLN